jgi:cell wall-associated NlpC family hydrolase
VQGAAIAPPTTAVTSSRSFRRIIILLTALALAVTLIAATSPEATYAARGKHDNNRRSEVQRVLKFARSHLGARFRIGTEGHRYFDCSGLVYRVYAQAGLLRRIGGGRMLAASYYKWFKRRGLVNRRNPKPGDLIWWTKKGRIEHIGIYVGNGRAISALTTGVKRHRLRSINVKLLGYGHVRLAR